MKHVDKDGAAKNRSVVRKEFKALKAELETLPPRFKSVWASDRSLLKKLYETGHIATNYIGEPIDQLPRFWLYVWPIRWPAIIGTIWYLASEVARLKAGC